MHHERDFCAVQAHTLGATQESRRDICQQPGIGIKGHGNTIRTHSGQIAHFFQLFHQGAAIIHQALILCQNRITGIEQYLTIVPVNNNLGVINQPTQPAGAHDSRNTERIGKHGCM